MKNRIQRKHIGLLVVMTLMVIAFFYVGEIEEIINALKNINIIYLLMALGCMVVYWLIEARTFYLVLRTFEPELKYGVVAKLVVATQFFNGVTPFSTGGQPFQIYILSHEKEIDVSSVTSASIHNFIMYQIVLVLMGALAIILSQVMGIILIGPQIKWMVILGFTLNIGVVLGLLVIAFVPKLTALLLKPYYYLMERYKSQKDYQTLRVTMESKVVLFHEQVWEVVKESSLFFQSLLLNMLKLLVLYSVTYFLCLTIGITSMTMLQGIIISAFVMLITSMVPIPGASGGAEFGFVILFGTLIGAQITVVMLLWRFVTYYVGMILGSLVYYFGYISES